MGLGEGASVGSSVTTATGRVPTSGVASASSMAVRDTWALTMRAMMSSNREPLTAPMPICMALFKPLKRAARWVAPVLILLPRKIRPGFIHSHSLVNRGPRTFQTARAATAIPWPIFWQVGPMTVQIFRKKAATESKAFRTPRQNRFLPSTNLARAGSDLLYALRNARRSPRRPFFLPDLGVASADGSCSGSMFSFSFVSWSIP